ncbi:MAG: transglutaminase-like domain-containing protein [Paenibacillaceae bacterium]
MINKLEALLQMNLITVLILCVFTISLALGFARGASATAKQLFQIVAYGAITVISLFLAWEFTGRLSPLFHSWLVDRDLIIPNEKLGPIKQLYYTFITGLRDFSLLRFASLFVPFYFAIRALLGFGFSIFAGRLSTINIHENDKHKKTISSGIIGVGIGSTLGAARALIIIAILFVYVTLQPQSSLSQYAQGSSLYQQGATQILAPFSEDFIATQVPVFTRAVEREFQNILQRKYEMIDLHIPEDIAGAAIEITKDKESDEEKAYALYNWIGSRIVYDHEKVRRYEEENIWLEQTPGDTFKSRKGVCIDYSRLYAVMARSIELEVKVITGLGYDGRGGYGPHAWNEVYISETNQWIPLDSTWASSGANWFNSEKFAETHIQDA